MTNNFDLITQGMLKLAKQIDEVSTTYFRLADQACESAHASKRILNSLCSRQLS